MSRIRPAVDDDVEAIVAAHVQADVETYRPIFAERFRARSHAESLARWRDALMAGDVLLVAEADGRIVGFAHARAGWMSALYLVASHQRRGLGAALLAELRRRVAARGVAEIEFQCVAANESAIAFYAAMGARQVGRKTEGEGDYVWEEVVFRLATASVPAFRAP